MYEYHIGTSTSIISNRADLSVENLSRFGHFAPVDPSVVHVVPGCARRFEDVESDKRSFVWSDGDAERKTLFFLHKVSETAQKRVLSLGIISDARTLIVRQPHEKGLSSCGPVTDNRDVFLDLANYMRSDFLSSWNGMSLPDPDKVITRPIIIWLDAGYGRRCIATTATTTCRSDSRGTLMATPHIPSGLLKVRSGIESRSRLAADGEGTVESL